jgi:hypothetical protein
MALPLGEERGEAAGEKVEGEVGAEPPIVEPGGGGSGLAGMGVR